MAQDSFTEVTSESWFSRIGGAIKGIVFGVVLVAVAFPLLFWNEGRSVKRYKTLKEGAAPWCPWLPTASTRRTRAALST